MKICERHLRKFILHDLDKETLSKKLLNHIDYYKTTTEEAGKKVLNPKLEVSRSKEQIKFLLNSI